MAAVAELLRSNLLAVITLSGSIIGFFSWLDKHASAQAKAAITSWLKSPTTPALTLAGTFDPLFRLVYGPKLLSVSGFVRSALVTLLICLILTATWLLANLQDLKVATIMFVDGGEFDSYATYYIDFPTFLADWIGFIGFYSVPCDYVSLLISWSAIRKSASLGLTPLSALLFVLAYLFCIGTYVVFLRSIGHFFRLTSHTDSFTQTWSLLYDALALKPLIKYFGGTGPHEFGGSLSPFVYSALFSLSWFMVFLTTCVLLKALMAAARALGLFAYLANIDDYPLTYIGFFAALICGSLYLIGLVVVRIA